MEWIIVFFHIAVAPFAIVHALLFKRDSRAALGWVGISLLFPVVGPLLYYFFGVNRLRARARELRGTRLAFLNIGYERGDLRPPEEAPPERDAHPLAHVGWITTATSLSHGNSMEMLVNGEAFFPRLVEDINAARHSINLATYIFSGHGIGAEVCDALADAAARGVTVRVLVDGIGSLYSLDAAAKRLRGSGVHVAHFHPPRLLPPTLSINMRNHRKLAIIDNECAYFGGMNIDDRHFVDPPRIRHPHADLHFRAYGPVVTSLQQVFAKDWHISSGEDLEPAEPLSGTRGEARARVIEDGPDESLDRLTMTLMGIFSGAQRSIRIVTPYFIPPRELAGALQAADIRGVRVEVFLPERSNLRFVDWATRHLLWELLQWGVEVYSVPAPFLHSKLVAVDDDYLAVGSANIDSRSLRLNFELGVEVIDEQLAAEAGAYIDRLESIARPITLEEVDGRSLPVRLRDSIFWLFSAYL